jgi:hypothetical protein
MVTTRRRPSPRQRIKPVIDNNGTHDAHRSLPQPPQTQHWQYQRNKQIAHSKLRPDRGIRETNPGAQHSVRLHPAHQQAQSPGPPRATIRAQWRALSATEIVTTRYNDAATTDNDVRQRCFVKFGQHLKTRTTQSLQASTPHRWQQSADETQRRVRTGCWVWWPFDLLLFFLLHVARQGCNEGVLRHFDAPHHLHALFTLFLLFQQLAFTSDIAPVTLCQDIFPHSPNVFPGNNSRAPIAA